MSLYSFTLAEDALGIFLQLQGPGMSTAYCVRTQQHLNARAAAQTKKEWDELIRSSAQQLTILLQYAFEAGKEARSDELRELLGEKKC